MGRETALNMTWSDEKMATRHQKLPPREPPPSTRWTLSRKVILIVAGLLALMAILVNVNCVILAGGMTIFAKPPDAVHAEQQLRATLEKPAVIGQPPVRFTRRLLRDQLIILLGLVVACCGCVAYLVRRKVLPPIRSIRQGAKEIASGRLDVTVPSQGKDEIAALGGAVNEIAANYQEVLLLTGTHAGSCLRAAEDMEEILKDGNGHTAADLAQQVALLKKELVSIVDVVHGFRFYDAHFNGREVVRRDHE